MVQSAHAMETVKETLGEEKPKRIIKRYSNRKLYDTKDSRYVTLQQIGEMVRAGEEVQIIDNATKEDKTEVTLALIISEDLKSQPRSVPLGTLRELIQERGERLLSHLREGPIGRLIPGGGTAEGGVSSPTPAPIPAAPASEPAAVIPPPAPSSPSLSSAAITTDADKPGGTKGRLSEIVESSKQTLDQWQHTIDERIRAILPGLGLFRELQNEVKRISQRLEEIEARLKDQEPRDEPGAERTESKAAGDAAEEGGLKKE